MQATFKRFSVIGGFAFLLAILFVDAYVTRQRLSAQVDTEAWVSHTRQVQLELSQTESLIKDAETGQRGYLYTGDEKYLAPYNSAITQMDAHLERALRLERRRLLGDLRAHAPSPWKVRLITSSC